MIPVTKPFLPPREEYEKYLGGIWDREWLTNMGPLSTKLEVTLKKFLDVKHILYVTNGTIALQMAIKALDLKGEIITTPFSFVATTSSIVWEGCKPVFVDIDEKSTNIDAYKIEEAITDETTAILATHVYGNPCDIDKIQEIATRYNLKVIYDAAHSFGVEYKGRSIFTYGDISICSLHATKLYHSIEGGLITFNDPELLKKLFFMRNFGFHGPEAFAGLGINGKNSEFHAAMGLINFKYFDRIVEKRKMLVERYDLNLKHFPAHSPQLKPHATKNYSYYPLIFQSEEFLVTCAEKMRDHEIYTRRYFYPSLATTLPYIKPQKLNVTDNVSKRVLCLPLYYDLTEKEVDHICDLLLQIAKDHQTVLQK